MNVGSGTVTGDIKSDESKVVHILPNYIGNSTTTIKELEKTSPRIIERALKEEHDSNCTKAYEEMSEITSTNGKT